MAQYLSRIGQPHIAKNVGVTTQQLAVDAVQHLAQGELVQFVGDLGVEDDLQPQIAQLLLQLVGCFIVQGSQHLVGFLQEAAFERLVRLLTIPGAAAVRVAQPAEDVLQSGEGARGLLHGQRRQVGAGQMVYPGLAIELVERHSDHLLLAGHPGRPDDGHRVLVGIQFQQGQLGRGGHLGAVELRQEQRHQRVDV